MIVHIMSWVLCERDRVSAQGDVIDRCYVHNLGKRAVSFDYPTTCMRERRKYGRRGEKGKRRENIAVVCSGLRAGNIKKFLLLSRDGTRILCLPKNHQQ